MSLEAIRVWGVSDRVSQKMRVSEGLLCWGRGSPCFHNPPGGRASLKAILATTTRLDRTLSHLWRNGCLEFPQHSEWLCEALCEAMGPTSYGCCHTSYVHADCCRLCCYYAGGRYSNWFFAPSREILDISCHYANPCCALLPAVRATIWLVHISWNLRFPLSKFRLAL